VRAGMGKAKVWVERTKLEAWEQPCMWDDRWGTSRWRTRKKKGQKRKKGEENTYLIGVDVGGPEHGHDKVAEGRRS